MSVTKLWAKRGAEALPWHAFYAKMRSMRTLAQERRRFSRLEAPLRFAVNVVHPRASKVPQSVNVSSGGVCLRLEETPLEVRSLVRMQLSSEATQALRRSRMVECTGRVAWVVQRLDLRESPPFLFDVGIEFVEPPATLRRLFSFEAASNGRVIEPAPSGKALPPAVLHQRTYAPRLQRELRGPLRWHLIVSVDGIPCFSGRYPSERAALTAWTSFKRHHARKTPQNHRVPQSHRG